MDSPEESASNTASKVSVSGRRSGLATLGCRATWLHLPDRHRLMDLGIRAQGCSYRLEENAFQSLSEPTK